MLEYSIDRYGRIISETQKVLKLDDDEIKYGTGGYYGLEVLILDRFFGANGFERVDHLYVKHVHRGAGGYHHFEIFDPSVIETYSVSYTAENLLDNADTSEKLALKEYFIKHEIGDWYYPKLGDIVDTEHGRGVVTEQDNQYFTVTVGKEYFEATKDMKRVGNIYEV